MTTTTNERIGPRRVNDPFLDGWMVVRSFVNRVGVSRLRVVTHSVGRLDGWMQSSQIKINQSEWMRASLFFFLLLLQGEKFDFSQPGIFQRARTRANACEWMDGWMDARIDFE